MNRVYLILAIVGVILAAIGYGLSKKGSEPSIVVEKPATIHAPPNLHNTPPVIRPTVQPPFSDYTGMSLDPLVSEIEKLSLPTSGQELADQAKHWHQIIQQWSAAERNTSESVLWYQYAMKIANGLAANGTPSEVNSLFKEAKSALTELPVSNFDSLYDMILTHFASQVIATNKKEAYLSYQPSQNAPDLLAYVNAATAQSIPTVQADPATAFHYIKTIDDPWIRAKAESLTLRGLSSTDLHFTLDHFLQSNEIYEHSPSLVSSLITVSASNDPGSLSEKISEMPASLRKDWAIATMIKEIAFEDQEGASLWAEQIQNADVRKEAFWHVENPLDNSHFIPEVREQHIKELFRKARQDTK